MSQWGFNIQEYKLVLGEFSNIKHLIVEGKTDKYFFTVLLDEFSKSLSKESAKDKSINFDEIKIDDIETFVKKDNTFQALVTDVTGNRTKIESIHKGVKNSPKYSNLVFFIDREFNDFVISFEQEIRDEISQHKIEGSLIWSRGHSIENYLFDFTVLRQALRRLSSLELYDSAIKLFETNFHLTIRMATAVSIALKECQKIQALEKIIDWELIDSSTFNLRIDAWKQRICERGKLSNEEAEKIVNNYKKWYSKLENDGVDYNLLRWICHGHIGSEIILGMYCSCLNVCFIKNNKNKFSEQIDIHQIYREANHKIQKSGKDSIWEEFANWWANKAVRNECFYPLEVLKKLGVI
jgi:hypothetical protein